MTLGVHRSSGGKAGLLAAALAASGLLAEAVLRVYAGTASTELASALASDPYHVLIEPHGMAGYRPRPNRTVPYANGTWATINSMGFRGPAVPVPKPAGTFRVVLLGGSTTFGWGVRDEETIDAHMRRLLAARHPGSSIDVVNLAFDGYDSYQLLERLRSEGARLQPDVVIVNTGINDVRHAPLEDIVDADPRTLLYRATLEQLRLEAKRGGPTLRTRTKHLLYLARLPGWLRGQAGRERTVVDEMPRWDALSYFERNVERLILLAREQGSVVLLSTPPSALRIRNAPSDPPEKDYWIRDAETTQVYRDSLQARLRTLASDAVEYVELEELELGLFLDDAHLTSEGNARVAVGLVSALERWLGGS